MSNVRFKKLPLLIAMALLSLCWQGSVAAERGADDLEDALMMELLKKRSKRRSNDDDDRPRRLSKADLRSLKSEDKDEVDAAVINDIKGMVKEPCLNLLASSELVTWSELKDRVEKAKKAIEMFEVKYKANLTEGKSASPQVATAGFAVAPKPAVMPGAAKPVFPTTFGVKPVSTPMGMPGAMPGIKPAGMPGVKPVAAPVFTPMGMPGIKPATPVAAQKAEEEEEEEEEEEGKKPVAGGMLGMKAPVGGGMPGLSAPAFGGMPVTAPAFGGMPVTAPAQPMKPAGMPGLGGMPGI
ncbi:hypothetical protein FJ364_04120 [Candidatus Dependentiae bacterium]|nr:hypothetical protein [Candidatus Dependentiae bacterium]